MDIPSNLASKLPAIMAPSSTSANTNQTDPLQHPLQATAMAIGGATGESRSNRMSHMASANEGPAHIIAKVSGAVQGGKREDDGAYFTSNEGIPFPDPSVPCHLNLRCSLLMMMSNAARTARLLAVFRSPAMCSCSSKRASARDGHQSPSKSVHRKQQHFNRSKNLERKCKMALLNSLSGWRVNDEMMMIIMMIMLFSDDVPIFADSCRSS